MKELKVKSLKLLIITVALIIALSQAVLATDFLVDVQSNSTGNQQGNSTGTTTQQIAPVEASFTAANETVYALRNTNIKESYSATSTTLSTLTKDASITRTGIYDNGWSRVQLANGTIGYVQTADLTTTAPTATVADPKVTQSEKEGSLPQTGIEDNPLMLVAIGGCIITAVFALKKIKEYNV